MILSLRNIQHTGNTLNLQNNILRQSSNKGMEKNLVIGDSHIDMINFENAPTLGGQYQYSKEDAIQNAWYKQNSFSIDDALNGKVDIKLSDLTVPSDFVKKLEKDGISNEVDFMYAGLDFNSMSMYQLKQSVDYMASRYAVMKEHINANFYEDEKAAKLKKLDDMVTSVKNNIATKCSEDVGTFFEDNGVSGEKERIYQSVLSEFDKKTNEYTDFIKENNDYAHINGTKDEWLKNDSAFLASELRKAVSTDYSISNKETDSRYTMDELEKIQSFVKETRGYSTDSLASDNRVNKWGTEEEIGMQLSEVVLKAEIFNKSAGISDKVKNIVTKSINHFVGNMMGAVQRHLDEEISMKDKDVPEAVLRRYASIDKSAVYDVINKVKSTYESTGSVHRALLAGATFAQSENDRKMQDSKYTELYRYKDSIYWDNFYKNTSKFTGQYDILGIARPNNGYIQKESGIESIIHSWNQFVGRITCDSSEKLNQSYFSAYA